MLSLKKMLAKILQNLRQPIKVQIVSRTVTVAQMDQSNIGNITAPTVNGYTFLYWSAFSTVGWISSVYPEKLNSTTTAVFQGALPRYKATTNMSIRAVAVYIRNDLA